MLGTSVRMKSQPKIRLNQLLVAGPTCGKTTLQHKAHGLNIIDTDDLTNKLIPEWFKDKLYTKSHLPLGRFAAKTRDLLIATTLNDMFCERGRPRIGVQKDLILANLWGPEFLKTLFGATKPWLYVGRKSHEEITRLSILRGSPLSEGLTSKWVASYTNHVPRVFTHHIWLPDGIYLSDVVKPVIGSNGLKASWEITSMGLALLDLFPNEVEGAATKWCMDAFAKSENDAGRRNRAEQISKKFSLSEKIQHTSEALLPVWNSESICGRLASLKQNKTKTDSK